MPKLETPCPLCEASPVKQRRHCERCTWGRCLACQSNYAMPAERKPEK